MKTNVRFSPRRLGHLNMFVSDVERSAAFYRDVCGFQEVFREPGISMIFMSNGNTHHDLGLMETTDDVRVGRDGHLQVKPGAGKTPGLNHLGLEMETESGLVDALRRARSHNLPISRTTDHQIAHSVYLVDSEGHMLEYYADVVDDWKRVYAENAGELISGHWDPDAQAPLTETKIALAPDLYRADESALMSEKVAFAALPVRDFDGAVGYYDDIVGLEVVKRSDEDGFAVLKGSASGGCDVCLVKTDTFPKVRLFFGGVRLHDGKPVQESFELLSTRGIPSVIVGDDKINCIVVIDPDGIPLVYSTAPSLDLMVEHGLNIVKQVQRLSASPALAS